MSIEEKFLNRFEHMTPHQGTQGGFYIGKWIALNKGVENMRRGIEHIYTTWETKTTS